jgi:hypothetical protein
VGSRSSAVAHSEVGGVEVDDSSMTMTKILRKRTTMAHSEATVKAAACSGTGAGIEVDRWR